MGAVLSLIRESLLSVTMLFLCALLLQWRIPRRRVLAVLIATDILLCLVYAACTHIFPHTGQALIKLLSFSLPSLILFLPLSQWRDARFLFVFCFAHSLYGCLHTIAQAADLLFPHSLYAPLLIRILLSAGVLLGAFGFRKPFFELTTHLKNYCFLFALSCIWFCLLLFAAAYYPSPIAARPEHYPLMLGLCFTFLLFYGILLVAIHRIQRNFQDLNHRHSLEQELTLQKVYRRMAYRDVLTGLRNRRAFEERLKEKEKKREPMCYVAADINDLKIINDTSGHLKGDEAIQQNARFLKHYENGAFRAYRVGGDEFALLSETTDMELAANTVSQLMHSAASDIDTACPSSLAIGYSFLTDYSLDSVHNLLVRGDQNMYEHKRWLKTGRKAPESPPHSSDFPAPHNMETF